MKEGQINEGGKVLIAEGEKKATPPCDKKQEGEFHLGPKGSLDQGLGEKEKAFLDQFRARTRSLDNQWKGENIALQEKKWELLEGLKARLTDNKREQAEKEVDEKIEITKSNLTEKQREEVIKSRAKDIASKELNKTRFFHALFSSTIDAETARKMNMDLFIDGVEYEEDEEGRLKGELMMILEELEKGPEED